MAILFDDFLTIVPDEHKDFVSSLHEQLSAQGCTIIIKEAKNGYAVSYKCGNKSVMNWVFRKSGVLARIYGDHVTQYQNVITELPADMQKKMTASRDCARLYDPSACSPVCVMGFVYDLAGETHKKCRNDGMFFLLSETTAPHIEKIVMNEVAARQTSA